MPLARVKKRADFGQEPALFFLFFALRGVSIRVGHRFSTRFSFPLDDFSLPYDSWRVGLRCGLLRSDASLRERWRWWRFVCVVLFAFGFHNPQGVFAQTLAGTSIEGRVVWQAHLDYDEEQYSSTATASLKVQSLPMLALFGQGSPRVHLGSGYSLRACNQGNAPLTGQLMVEWGASSSDYRIMLDPPRITLAPNQCTNVTVTITSRALGSGRTVPFTIIYRDDLYGEITAQHFSLDLLPEIETTLQLTTNATSATAQLSVSGWGLDDRLQLRFTSHPTSAPYQFAHAQVNSDCGAEVVFDASGAAQITNLTGANRCTLQIVLPLDTTQFPSGAAVELRATVTQIDGISRTATVVWVNRTRRRVLDARTQIPLAGASITVSTTGRTLTQVLSDSTGAWSIPLATLFDGADTTLFSAKQTSTARVGGERNPTTLWIEVRAARHTPTLVEMSVQPDAVGYRLTTTRVAAGQATLPSVEFVYSELTFDVLLAPLYTPVELRKRPLQSTPRLLLGAAEAALPSTSPTVERGGAISYEIEVISNDYSGSVVIRDQLPVGMRFLRAGVASPTSSDFVLELTPGQRRVIRYSAVVGADAPLGWAVNRAQAFDLQGRVLSSPAVASVQVTSGLYADDLIVVGRVFYDLDGDGRYAPQHDLAASATRLITSNGRVALTDKQGRFHFSSLPHHTFSLMVDLPDCRGSERLVTRCQQMVLPLTLRGGGVVVVDFPLPASLAKHAVLPPQGPLPFAATTSEMSKSTPLVQGVVGQTAGVLNTAPSPSSSVESVALRQPRKRSFWRKLLTLVGIETQPLVTSNPSTQPTQLTASGASQRALSRRASHRASLQPSALKREERRAGRAASKVLPTDYTTDKILNGKEGGVDIDSARDVSASASASGEDRSRGVVAWGQDRLSSVGESVGGDSVRASTSQSLVGVGVSGAVGGSSLGGMDGSGDLREGGIVVPTFIIETEVGEQLQWVRVDDREVGAEQVGRTERYADGRVRRYYYVGLSAGPHELIYSVQGASGGAQQKQRRIHVQGEAQRVEARLVGERLELRFADAWGQPARDRQVRFELRGAVSGCVASDRVAVEGGLGVIPCVRLLSDRGEVVIHRGATPPLVAGFTEERSTAFGWGEVVIGRGGRAFSGGVYIEGVSLARAAGFLRGMLGDSTATPSKTSSSLAAGASGSDGAPAEGAPRGLLRALGRVRIDFVGDLRERLLDGQTIPFASRGGSVVSGGISSGELVSTSLDSGSSFVGASMGAFSRYREFADASIETLVAASTWRWWGRVRIGDHSAFAFGYLSPFGEGGDGPFGGVTSSAMPASFRNVSPREISAGGGVSLLTWTRTVAGGRFSGKYHPFGHLLRVDLSAGYGYGREQIIERFTPTTTLRLSRRDLVFGTEIVVVEHRSRLSPQLITRRETLVRAVDYDLDPSSATILLKRYVPLTDEAGDPLLIAVSYAAGLAPGSEVLAFGRVVLGITKTSRVTLGLGGSESGARAVSIEYTGPSFKGGSLTGEVAATRGGSFQLTPGLRFGARLRATQEIKLAKRRIGLELSGQLTGFGFSDPFGFNTLAAQTTTDLTGRATSSLAGGRVQIGWRYTTSAVLVGATEQGYARLAPRRQASVDASFGREWSRLGFELGLRAVDIIEGSPQSSGLRLSTGLLSFASFAGVVSGGSTGNQGSEGSSFNTGYRSRALVGRVLFRYRPRQGVQIEFIREQPLWLHGVRDFATVAASEVRATLTRGRVELSGRVRYVDSTRFHAPYSVATVGGNLLSLWTHPGRFEGSFAFGYRRGAYALRVQGSRAGAVTTTSLGGERLFTWRTVRVVLGAEATRLFQPSHTLQSSSFSPTPTAAQTPPAAQNSPSVTLPFFAGLSTRTIPRFYFEATTPRASVRFDIARRGRTVSFSLTPRGTTSAARISFAATDSFGSRQLLSTIDGAHRSTHLITLARVDLRRQSSFGQGVTLLGASVDATVAQPIARVLQPALRVVFSRLAATHQYASPVIFEGEVSPLSTQRSNEALFAPTGLTLTPQFSTSSSVAEPRAWQALSAPISSGLVGLNQFAGGDASSTVRVTTALLAPRVDLILGKGFDLRSEARAFWQNRLWSGGGAVEVGRRFGVVRLALGYAERSRALAVPVTLGASRGFYLRVDASSEILTLFNRR